MPPKTRKRKQEESEVITAEELKTKMAKLRKFMPGEKEKEQEEQPRGDVVAAEDVEQQPEEEEEGEGDIEEEEEEQTELRAPLGDWWARIYTYDEVIELLDELLPKKHKKGMKGLLTKGAKKGKGKGRKGKASSSSADPPYEPTEEEEEEMDEEIMSPAAKILKLGAEDTVSDITNYLLHYLGREVEEVQDSQANCLVDAFLSQLRKIYFLPAELTGDALRHNTMAFLLNNLNDYENEIVQELEGTGSSIGMWIMRQLNPDVFLDMTFMYLLHEMTKIPTLIVAPENVFVSTTSHLLKWKGAWVYHFNTNDEDLLDHNFPAILCYNGIHHYTSTKLHTPKSRDHATINLLVKMAFNMKTLSENLKGHADVKSMITLTFDQLKAVRRDPSSKVTVTSSAAPHSAPSKEEKFKYACDQCEKKFQRSNELQAHLVSKHGEGYPCSFCDIKPFSSQPALNVHMTTKHQKAKSKVYSCPDCDYTSNRTDAVKAHRVRNHGLQIDEADMVKCPNAPECTKTFITDEQCRRHVRLICQKGATIKCKDPSCKRTFKNQQQMLQHYPIHTEAGKEWLCKVCGKQCASLQSYKQHMKRHPKE